MESAGCDWGMGLGVEGFKGMCWLGKGWMGIVLVVGIRVVLRRFGVLIFQSVSKKTTQRHDTESA